MHKIENYVFCDGCGKEIGKSVANHTSFFFERHPMLTIFKGFNAKMYDFCPDCYKKAQKAVDDICKKEK